MSSRRNEKKKDPGIDDLLQPKWPNLKGAAAALLIIGVWTASLVVLLTIEPGGWSWWVVPAMLLQTFLYTGLFITAHDSMHSAVTPDFPRFNRAVGTVAVGLYALFSFPKLRRAHRAHHRHPASDDDPDFHDPEHDGVLRWYLRFMTRYVSVGQLVGMALAFNVMHYLLGVAVANLVVFWVIPALASTLQLFWFGTVLPHRRPDSGYDDHHRAESNDFSPVVSFLTCYHFGYHWEHHERPDLPWWRLPRFRRLRKRTAGG